MRSEGSWRSHQVLLSEMATNPDHAQVLGEWMESYRPEGLFDEAGKLSLEPRGLAPKGTRRM